MTSEVPAESSSWLASWAPPESRRGALQRGRGDGFRAALAGGSEAAAEVVGCVLADPRWDSQVESRDDHYARLLLALAADLTPIAARLAELADDASLDLSDVWLPLGVCGELAARGHPGAREILAGLVARTRLWRPCLDALASAGGADLIAAVVSPADAAAFVARAAPTELAHAVDLIAAPWATWAAQLPTLRPLLLRRDAERRASCSPPVALDPALSAAALLAIELPPRRMHELADLLDARRDAATTAALLAVATTPTHPARATALRLLGRRACVDLLDDATAYLRAEAAPGAPRATHGSLRGGYLQYLERLPAAVVLPLARAWFAEPWPLSLAAGGIFERHATAEDRPVLVAAGATALASGEMYRLCHVLAALAVVADPAAIDLLCAVVHAAPYSYARRLALAALVPHTGRADVDAVLTDALWDCEADARWIACDRADLAAPTVRARLDEIAADEREDTELRALAREVSAGP